MTIRTPGSDDHLTQPQRDLLASFHRLSIRQQVSLRTALEDPGRAIACGSLASAWALPNGG